MSRCAAVVTVGPATAPDLDFLAGMDQRARNRRSAALRGDTDVLRQEWDNIIAWAREATGDGDGEMDSLLAETLEAAGPHGINGFVDDHLSVVRNWGFAVEAIRVPGRIMLAREDTSVPAAHGEWLASHLREGELLWVDGDHFGPRNASEIRLIEWVARG